MPSILQQYETIGHTNKKRIFRKADVEMIRGKIRGSLMAGAAGDALGYPVAFISRRAILSRYREKGITHIIHRFP